MNRDQTMKKDSPHSCDSFAEFLNHSPLWMSESGLDTHSASDQPVELNDVFR